jgi:starch synthase
MQNLGVLGEFVTSSYITSPVLQKLIESLNINTLKRRFEHGLSAPKVRSNWRFEIPELFVRRIKTSSKLVTDLICARDKKFDIYVSRHILNESFSSYWGFQGSCLESLKRARAYGMTAVCEMTSHFPFANDLLREEQRLIPEWADSIDFTMFPAWYEKRLVEEPYIASSVVTISSFQKRTLLSHGIEDEKIAVIPLGLDISNVKYIEEHHSLKNRPLRILYAGKVTQLKGIFYLLESMRSFNKNEVELHIIGDILGSGKAFRKYKDLYKYRPAVGQVELFTLYADYDLLVFPSLLEGFGLVSIEAMGAGLPVITTPNTNAAEVMKDGVNGFVVPIRDIGAITKAITRLRNMDDNSYYTMRLNARRTAENFTWLNYQMVLERYLNISKV